MGQSPLPGLRAAPARMFSLAWRIFLGSAVVVAIVLVATLAVASTVASSNATAAIKSGLEQTNRRVFDLLASERTTMLKLTEQFANKPEFRAGVSSIQTAKDTAGAFATAYDQSIEAATAVGASRAQIIDAEGVLLARSDDAHAHGNSLGGALIGGALEGQSTQGFGVADSTSLAQVVAVPIPGAGGSQAGVLMSLEKIDDSLAIQIGAQTGSELVFYIVPGPNARPQIAVSSPKLGPRTTLAAAIESAMMNAAPASQGKPDTSSMMIAVGAQHDVRIAGTNYVGQRVAALSAGKNEVGGFIALRDLDHELAPYYKLRNALLFAGAAGLLLAFLLSLVISRQIVRPVQALVAATQRAADGDYNAEIPASSRDEVGTLAGAFRRLLADLRDKQALVDFLQSPGAGRTISIQSPLPTLQMAAMGAAAL
ncbi:MAG: HAMP domain-containing protein, partial [Gemmatimonadaceae bacterium]